ncbi:MAG: sigma-70 family RNA polymerase sigma factor [Lentisphaeraceae bacterium]|nr:sigma-70 family RNA polymerase sigma factor [Lentisphaeraceae bacterium]
MKEISKELISQAKCGDLQAFEEIVSLTITDVRCLVAFHFPDSAVVDDLTQEIYILTYRSLKSFSEGSFAAWLKTIVWNRVRTEKLKRKRLVKNLANLKDFLIIKHEVPEEHPAISNLEECYKHLNEEHRLLIKLKYKERFSSKELASHFGKSSDWVRTSLYRLRSSLRECLDTFSGVHNS